MRHCQPCPSLLSLPKSPLPKRRAPVRTLSTLLRAQDWCHVSLLGPPAAMGCAEPGPLWSHIPAWSCPNAWGGAWYLGLPCASLLLAGVMWWAASPALLFLRCPDKNLQTIANDWNSGRKNPRLHTVFIWECQVLETVQHAMIPVENNFNHITGIPRLHTVSPD